MKVLGWVVLIAVAGYAFGWIAKDSANRLHEHDHHYCVSIEGHSEQECADLGR